jgi:hypothetical protein
MRILSFSIDKDTWRGKTTKYKTHKTHALLIVNVKNILIKLWSIKCILKVGKPHKRDSVTGFVVGGYHVYSI